MSKKIKDMKDLSNILLAFAYLIEGEEKATETTLFEVMLNDKQELILRFGKTEPSLETKEYVLALKERK
ncbi:MAG: hypothetical protein KAJ51_17910 [Thermoplasmata archaeon]|nr:hypothetical protein [Thermoplasmata archaeon]